MTVLRRHPTASYFALAYTLTWAVWIPAFSSASDLRFSDVLGAIIAGSFGPSAAGLVMAGVTGGRRSVRTMLRRLIAIRRTWWLWVVGCFGGYPVLLVVLGVVDPSDLDTTARVIGQGLIAVLPVSLANIVLGPLGEELGWRGFALPRLLDRMRPLQASVLLGLIWAGWHLPLGLLGDSWAVGNPALWWLLLYPTSVIGFAVVLTFMHLRGRGSLALAIVVHSALNTLLATVSEVQAEGAATGLPEAVGAALTAAFFALPFAVALARRTEWPAAPSVQVSAGLDPPRIPVSEQSHHRAG
jgi:uncharacterized protein